MYQLSLLLVCACALVGASHINSLGKPFYPLEEAEIHFEAFIEKFNRSYSTEDEKIMRFEIFKQKLEIINENNLDPLSMAIFDITQFTDLSDEEFTQNWTGLVLSSSEPDNLVNISGPVTIKDLPDSFDWRDQNAVTPVKNQGSCGACYAFAVIGSLESSYARKYQRISQFSEQQIVDCCNCGDCVKGGNPTVALNYLQNNGGVEGEDDYPYQTQQNTCQFDASKVKATVSQVVPYNLESEEALRQALYTNGPIAIAINVKPIEQYRGGIVKGSQCPALPLNHAVLLVGYGTENGVPFWIIKNSWGMWGEQGYLRITRNENTCGLLNKEAVSAVAG
ncbi:uncharacterized protein LOC126374633 isoform X2 [Pectinophora gossypiella]|uniref:uncharacterized protein LOC126374633 isoform X2 n=1 Tax=Pectinophora gossypiella TaxID=13191 RepID=UPI00214E310C|nr:uncharacterized protein LOC126374633 isoform X2 [Pectinophora gossypiella]